MITDFANISDDLATTETEELRDRISQDAYHWSKQKLLAVMGTLNSITYRAAQSIECVSRGFDKEILVNDIKLHLHGGLCLIENLIHCATKATVSYLQRFWDGAISGKGSILAIRAMFQEWGLFVELPCVPRKHGQIATVTDFDMSKALIVFDQLQRIWFDRGYTFEELPKHRANFMKMLFDAMFVKSIGMGRRDEEDPDKRSSLAPDVETAQEERSRVCKITENHNRERLEIMRGVLEEWEVAGIDRACPEIFREQQEECDRLAKWLDDRIVW